MLLQFNLLCVNVLSINHNYPLVSVITAYDVYRIIARVCCVFEVPWAAWLLCDVSLVIQSTASCPRFHESCELIPPFPSFLLYKVIPHFPTAHCRSSLYLIKIVSIIQKSLKTIFVRNCCVGFCTVNSVVCCAIASGPVLYCFRDVMSATCIA